MDTSTRREKGSSSRLELLKRVAERGDTVGIARILALDNEKKKKAIIRPPNISKPKIQKPPSKPTNKKPRKPACKPTKPARRCAAS